MSIQSFLGSVKERWQEGDSWREPGDEIPQRHIDPAIRREAFRLTSNEPGSLELGWLSIPVWARILAVYLASRIVTTIILLTFAAREGATWQTNPQPNYLEFANIWDAEWYSRIAYGGYPTTLPMDDQGHITENAWAFMPVYPCLIRLMMAITGMPFEALSITISVLAGLGVAFAVHRLFSHVVDPSGAMFGTALVCFMPTSVIFQVGYAEALHAFLLTVLLICLVERRWMVMVPVIVLASFTRPTGLAWAMTLVLYLAYRIWTARRGLEQFSTTERWDVVIAIVVSVISGFGWVFVAWIATGIPSAYLDTEFAWRSHYTGWDTFHGPFTGWFQGAQYWIDFATGRSLPEPWRDVLTWGGGAVVVVLFFGCCFGLIASRLGARLGIEIRLWLVSYLSYILAVFFPQSSTFRLLMPLFPSLAVVGVPKSPLYRVVMMVLSILGQVAWIWMCWYVIDYDWSPP